MTIFSDTNRRAYTGNGVTRSFPFPYYFLSPSDLVVIAKSVTTGLETKLTLDTDYSILGEGQPGGGSIEMLGEFPPAGDIEIVIYRDPERIQDLDLVNNDAMPAEELEKRFDKSAMWAIRDKERIDRSVKLSEGFSGVFDPTLPASLPPNTTVLVNEAGTGFTTGPKANEISSARTHAENAAASEASANTAAGQAQTSAYQASQAMNLAVEAQEGSYTNALSALESAERAEASEQILGTAAGDVTAIKDQAEAASTTSVNAAAASELAKDESVSAKNEAVAARDQASGSATAAAGAATSAQTALDQTAANVTASTTARTGAETARAGAETARDAAATSATASETSRVASEAARDTALQAAEDAGNIGNQLSTFANDASIARDEAVTARDESIAARDAAATSASTASGAVDEVTTIRTDVLNGADTALSAAAASALARDESQTARDESVVARDQATGSAAAASTARDESVTARDAAAGSATASEASRVASETARTGSEAARDEAATSATAAAGSATAADTARIAAETARDEAVAAGGGGGGTTGPDIVQHSVSFVPATYEDVIMPEPGTVAIQYLDGQLMQFNEHGSAWPFLLDKGSENAHPFEAAYKESKYVKGPIDQYATVQWHGNMTGKITNPPAALNVPTAVRFSPDGKYLVVGNGTTAPFLDFYLVNQQTNTLTKLTAPATPGGAVRCMCWDTFGDYLFVGTAVAPFIRIYTLNRSNNTLALDPYFWGTNPGSAVNSIEIFNISGKMVVGTEGSPFIHVYNLDLGYQMIEKGSNPASLPQGAVKGVAVSSNTYPINEWPSVNYIACAMAVSPFVAFYKIIDDWPPGLERLPNPAALPPGALTSAAWSRYDNDHRIAFGCSVAPFIVNYDFTAPTIDPDTYAFTEAIFTKVADPSTYNRSATAIKNVRFSLDGRTLAAASGNNMPEIWTSVRRGNTGSLQGWGLVASAGAGVAVDFNKNHKYLAFVHAGTPFVGVHKNEMAPPIYQVLGITE